jgi:hypothetical protein
MYHPVVGSCMVMYHPVEGSCMVMYHPVEGSCMVMYNPVEGICMVMYVSPVEGSCMVLYRWRVPVWSCYMYHPVEGAVWSCITLFGADPDRIGLLGNPPAAEHSSPPRASSCTCFLRSPHANAGMKQYECGRTQPLFRAGHDRGINKRSKPNGLR